MPTDDDVRREGIADAAAPTTKRFWMIVACCVPRCPECVAIPLGDAFRNERALRAALAEHEGPIYKSWGGWSVVASRLTRTLQIPIKGYAPLCPKCTAARTRKATDHAIGQAARGLVKGIRDEV